MIGIIGDVHGQYDDLKVIFEKYPEVSYWFQVGDLGREGEKYPELPSNFFFIKGNHENWDELANCHYLPNGSIAHLLDGEILFTVCTLGGNYSPAFFKKRPKDLFGDRRRHFVEEEVEILGSFKRKTGTPTILLTHEAPSPFTKTGTTDIGQPVITQLVKTIRPDVHFFGHHHIDRTVSVEGIPCVGIGRASNFFILYDLAKKSYLKIIP